MSGSFIHRHHVEPRVKLLAERGIIPIPLKYIDVSRVTHTNLDVKQKNASMIVGISIGLETCLILGQVSHNSLLEEKAPDGYMWSGERLTR